LSALPLYDVPTIFDRRVDTPPNLTYNILIGRVPSHRHQVAGFTIETPYIREFAAATGSHPVADQACGGKWLWITGAWHALISCVLLGQTTTLWSLSIVRKVILVSRL
jgi:hypothetical protein